jgi:hypothetical protein
VIVIHQSGSIDRCIDKTVLLVVVQVYSFVDLSELYYAGSHGMDIKGPSSKVMNRTSYHSSLTLRLLIS